MIKVLYAGSPGCAAKTLQLLLNCQGDWQIAGVLTNPPSTKGRHKDLIPTPAGALAAENNIPVFSPEHLDAEFRGKIEPLGFDLLVCFAYGHIFGPKFLSLFKMGGCNVHPSLLPKYRGATPVPAAILSRDKETGVTVQTIALGMDEGDILASQKVELDFTENTDSLLDRSAEVAAGLLKELLDKTASQGNLPKGEPQSGEVSYTKTITREDALICWSESAEVIDAKIRAYTSEPGAWTRIGSERGENLKIIKASPADEKLLAQKQIQLPQNASAEKCGSVILFDKRAGIFIKCGSGFLCVTELQRQQKKAMGYKDFMNGARDFVGSLLV